VVLDGGETADSFPADTEPDIWRRFSAQSGRFSIGPGPMNVRPILKWNDDGDHMVHVWVFPRYTWSSDPRRPALAGSSFQEHLFPSG
jgi:hypothetical protein